MTVGYSVPEMFEQNGYQTAVYLLNISGIIEIIFAYTMAFYKNSDENQGGVPQKGGKIPQKVGKISDFPTFSSNFSRAILILLWWFLWYFLDTLSKYHDTWAICPRWQTGFFSPSTLYSWFQSLSGLANILCLPVFRCYTRFVGPHPMQFRVIPGYRS